MTPKQKAHKIDTQIFFVLQQKFWSPQWK
jgi:hypothetical protein